MPSLLLKVALLIAVATSQVFGGVSCCCFGRVVFSFFVVEEAKALKTNLSQEAFLPSHIQPQGKCPKCMADRKGSNAVSTRVGQRKQLCRQQPDLHDDGQCRCSKLALTASTESDTPVIDSRAHGVPVHGFVVEPERQNFRLVVRKYEVPLRYGGHSWQSFACVWKN